MNRASSKAAEPDTQRVKTQSSIEFLSIFAVALLVVFIVLTFLAALFPATTSTLTTSSCYISPELPCSQLQVSSNGILSTAIIVFTNNLGQSMRFPSNAFTIYPTSSQKGYTGSCLPTNALPNSQVICVATTTGFNPQGGAELNPKFLLNYYFCQAGSCTGVTTNSVGTGTTYVYPGLTKLYNVELVSNPSVSSAMVTLSGVPYPVNTFVYFLASSPYSIYPDPPSGYTFSSWSSLGGVAIKGASPQASASATSNGVVVMNLNVVQSPLQIAVPTPASSTITQCATDPITDSGASGGVPPYSYQWLTAPPPGTPPYTAAQANALLGIGTAPGYAQSVDPSFVTNAVTTTGVYGFELQATDSVGNAKTSNPATVTVLPLQFTLSAANYPIIIEDLEHSCVAYDGYAYCTGGQTKFNDANVPTGGGSYLALDYANDITPGNTFIGQITPMGISSWTRSSAIYPVSGVFPSDNGIDENSCVLSGSTLICIGGSQTGDYSMDTSAIEYATLSAGGGMSSWSTDANAFPIKVNRDSCVVSTLYGDYIYCIGGFVNGYGTITDKVYSAQVSATTGTGPWTDTGANYQTIIASPGCAIVGSNIYCVGGIATPQPTYTPTSASYNALIGPGGTLGAWSADASYTYAVQTPICMSSGTDLYCISGALSGGSPLNNYYADVSSGTITSWNQFLSTLPSGLNEQGCFIDSNNMYCVGGDLNNNDVFSSAVYSAPLSGLYSGSCT